MGQNRGRYGEHTETVERTTDEPLEIAIQDLKSTLGHRSVAIRRVKESILTVCRILEISNVCKNSEIGTRLKQILQKEIMEKKITARYIRKVLPSKFKRAYHFKREHVPFHHDDYDFGTCKSLRKKMSIIDDVLECQICLPLQLFKRKFKSCQLAFPSKSVWFKIDVDLRDKRLTYFGLGDGARSPPLFSISLHRD